jgi:hypothetical protein
VVPPRPSALDRRRIVDWVSGVDLWKRLQGSRGDLDLACALTLLASLELNLRADGRRASPLFQPDAPKGQLDEKRGDTGYGHLR